MSGGIEAAIKSADVVAFTDPFCPFCADAFRAMDAQGIKYEKVQITPAMKRELIQKTGKGSVPSVWIKGTYVGGCNDGTEPWHGVKPMLRSGKFQEMLAATSAPPSEVETAIKSADVVIFKSDTCPFCVDAFRALDAQGIKYQKVQITPAMKQELIQKTGKGSVPSVWIKGTYVGGCEDGTERWHGVKPMLKSGKFQEMLAATSAPPSAVTRVKLSDILADAGA